MQSIKKQNPNIAEQCFILPRTIFDMRTVKIGAELFIVSVKLTAMNFKETNPRTTVTNLQKRGINSTNYQPKFFLNK